MSNKKMGKPTDQRLAILRNLSVSLLRNKRIITTTTRAKELKKYLEKLICIAIKNDLNSKRLILKYINNKHFLTQITDYSRNLSADNGGYIKMVKCGLRKGDAAEMTQLQLK